MTTVAIIGGAVLLLAVAAGWYVKRKLERMGRHLPGALEQWEKEIEKLEKPKG
jgi:hypothetical protein